MKIFRLTLVVLLSVLFSATGLFAEPRLGKKIFDDGNYAQPAGNTGKIAFFHYGKNDIGRLQYELMVGDPKTGKAEKFNLELKVPPPQGSIVWSKDGSQLAVVRKDLTPCDIYSYSASEPFKINKLTDLTPYVADLDTALMNKRRMTPDMLLNVADMDWSFNDSMIVFSMMGYQNVALWTLEVATGKLRQISEEHFGSSPCWAPDGKAIYLNGMGDSSGKPTQDIYKLNMEDYSVEPIVNTKATETGPDVSPDGKYLVYTRSSTEEKQTIYVYDIGNKKSAKLVILGPNQTAAFPTWTADGKSVIYDLIETGNTYPDLYQIGFDPGIFK